MVVTRLSSKNQMIQLSSKRYALSARQWTTVLLVSMGLLAGVVRGMKSGAVTVKPNMPSEAKVDEDGEDQSQNNVFTTKEQVLKYFAQPAIHKLLMKSTAKCTKNGKEWSFSKVLTCLDVGSKEFSVQRIGMLNDTQKFLHVNEYGIQYTDKRYTPTTEGTGHYFIDSATTSKRLHDFVTVKREGDKKEECGGSSKDKLTVEDLQASVTMAILTGQTREAFNADKTKAKVLGKLKKMAELLCLKNFVIFCPSGEDEGILELISARAIAQAEVNPALTAAIKTNPKRLFGCVMSSGGGSGQTSFMTTVVSFIQVAFNAIKKFVKKDRAEVQKELVKAHEQEHSDRMTTEWTKFFTTDKAVQTKVKVIQEQFKKGFGPKGAAVLCISGFINMMHFDSSKCGYYNDCEVSKTLDLYKEKQFIDRDTLLGLVKQYGEQSVEHEAGSRYGVTTRLLCAWFMYQIKLSPVGTQFWLQRMFVDEQTGLEIKAGGAAGIAAKIFAQATGKLINNVSKHDKPSSRTQDKRTMRSKSYPTNEARPVEIGLNVIEKQEAALTPKVGRLERHETALKRTIAGLEKRETALDDNIHTLERQRRELTAIVAEHRGQKASLKKEVDKLERQRRELTAIVAEQRKDQTNVGDQVALLKDEKSNLKETEKLNTLLKTTNKILKDVLTKYIPCTFSDNTVDGTTKMRASEFLAEYTTDSLIGKYAMSVDRKKGDRKRGMWGKIMEQVVNAEGDNKLRILWDNGTEKGYEQETNSYLIMFDHDLVHPKDLSSDRLLRRRMLSQSPMEQLMDTIESGH